MGLNYVETLKLSEFSKSELKEILTKQGWDDIATWEYMTT